MILGDIVIPPHPTSEITLAVGGGTFLAHFWGYLPGVVATIGGALAIVWYVLMILESKYVQEWLTRHSTKSKLRQIAKLKARQKIIEAQLSALEVRKIADAIATDKIESARVDAAATLAGSAAAMKAVDNKVPDGGKDAQRKS